ncbi:MAG: DUF6398 domain-containing protein [Acidimicrobiia bacterium]
MSKKKRKGRHPRSGQAAPGGKPREFRGRPRTSPNTTPEDEFFANARGLLASTDPLAAEELASSIVAVWYRGGIGNELDTELATTVVEALAGTSRPESLVILLGLGAVAPGLHAARARRGVEQLVEDGVAPPAWASDVGRAEVSECWITSDVLGDGRNFLLGCRYPDGKGHSVVVYIDTNLGVLVKDAFVVPAPITEVLDVFRSQAPEAVNLSLAPIDPATASAHIRDALERNDMTYPPIETETFPAVRALLDARLATMPGDGALPARPEWSEAERNELVAEFLASSEATEWADDPDAEEIAELLVWHGCDYDGSGDPLRWSPVVVEIVLCDWLPRKAALERSVVVKVPFVLQSFVRFAGRRRDLPSERVAETAAAINAYGADYLEAMEDPETWGPAKVVFSKLTAAGVDLSDETAVASFIAELNRTGDPLAQPVPAHQDFDWKGIPGHVSWRVSEILRDVDRVCAQCLDDEYRVLAYDLVRRLALRRTFPLSKAFTSSWAAGVLHFLGQRGSLFKKESRPYVTTARLASAVGVSTATMGNKSKQIRELLALPEDNTELRHSSAPRE